MPRPDKDETGLPAVLISLTKVIESSNLITLPSENKMKITLLLLISTCFCSPILFAGEESDFQICQPEIDGTINPDSECWEQYIKHITNLEPIFMTGTNEIDDSVNVDNQTLEPYHSESLAYWELIEIYGEYPSPNFWNAFVDVASRLESPVCLVTGKLLSADVCFNHLRTACMSPVCGLWAIYQDGKLTGAIQTIDPGPDSYSEIRLYAYIQPTRKAIPVKAIQSLLKRFQNSFNREFIASKKQMLLFFQAYWNYFYLLNRFNLPLHLNIIPDHTQMYDYIRRGRQCNQNMPWCLNLPLITDSWLILKQKVRFCAFKFFTHRNPTITNRQILIDSGFLRSSNDSQILMYGSNSKGCQLPRLRGKSKSIHSEF